MPLGKDFKGDMRVSVDVDARQVADLQERLAGIPNGFNRVMALAINDTVRSGKQVMVKGLFDLTTAKQGEIRKRIGVTKATRQNLVGKIRMRNTRFAARRFKHRERRNKRGWGTAASGEGVFLQVLKSGEVQRFPHAFLATTEVRGSNIFQRTTQGPGSDRNKITVIPAIDIGELFWRAPGLGDRLIDRMRSQLGKNMESKADYVLSKKK